MPKQEAIMASTWVPQPEVEVVVAADTVVEAPVAAPELVDVWAAARPATARAMMAVRIFNTESRSRTIRYARMIRGSIDRISQALLMN